MLTKNVYGQMSGIQLDDIYYVDVAYLCLGRIILVLIFRV